MTDQMTPADMRKAAGFAARQIPRDDIEAANLRTLAEAARRLADVIEYLEEDRGAYVPDLLRIARGEDAP